MSKPRTSGKKKANDGMLQKSRHTAKGSSQRPAGMTKLEVRQYDYDNTKFPDGGYRRPGSQNRNK